MTFLNSTDVTEADFKGSNPTDYIYTILFYPFQPFSPAWSDKKIKLGPVDTGITAPHTPQYYGLSYNYSLTVEPYFNDFRDKPPYTTMVLYTPCGSIEIDPVEFYNSTINVDYYLDYVTGSCRVLISKNALVISEINGRIGANVQITANNMGQYQNALAMLENQKKSNEVSIWQNMISGLTSAGLASVGALSGSPTLLISGVSGYADSIANTFKLDNNAGKIDYQISHTYPPVNGIGSTSTVNNLILQFIPKLLVKRCLLDKDFNANAYGKTVGYSCMKQGKLKDFSGFTVCANVNLDKVNCTVSEKDILKNGLISGVYI